jgi:predicted amidohydrolase YtcJ
MPDADLVLSGGRVRALDGRGSDHSALAIRGDRIVAVGDDAAMTPWVGLDTRSLALDGRTVVPGFIDPHTHVAGNARDPRNVECRDFFDPTITSIDDILSRMRDAAARLPAGEWVVAISSPMPGTRLAGDRALTKADLDQAVPDRPAFISFGPHQSLANSRALDACGIGRDTPDPNGGEIVRGPDGSPTGLLRETAQQVVKRTRPGVEDDLETRLLGELERCAARGVTQIHDVVTTPAEVRAYASLAASGRLPVRVRLLVRAYQSQFETWGIARLGVGPDFGSDDLRIGAVKLSVDGGSSAGQAAFYPAAGQNGEDPVLRMTQKELDPIVAGYHAAGIQVCIHAVGDLAVDMALGSLAAALRAEPRADHRHRVEHMGNFAVTQARLATARELGLVPIPNPTGLYYLGPSSMRTYTPERLGRVYAFRLLLDEGLPFTTASDGGGLWPVDPLRDIGAAVSRVARDGTVIGADDAVTVDEALRAYTSGAAWAGFDEDRLGSLTPGKRADLAVLAADPSAVDPERIGTIEVDLTLKGGRIVHERAAVPIAAGRGDG